ncbi:MAG: hypothetical protein A2381_18175 [Bdellovibrionales bacterium RIFOXYB1_FULL_37_110]|nr:MAG: hypothetical protein A2417_06640 [Bdellovibrionales bacterium RIFOXYC1_FULL_37_79]OFZ58600.1 MAG: hypothetical protein A2381_18175 [Bdellovibrionales bacterium RIFOXYB1_FULL_37_110]OFZ61738.1 MAG: hypothetical protein A2577_19515 [Bdellovibrionales bacterium RIFOXYD1_FULL_36_51]
MKKKILVLTLIIYSTFPWAGVKWEGTLPKIAQDHKTWEILLNELLEKEMYYGALVTAYRGLLYYDNLATKQKAYQTIVALIDLGYPENVLNMFVTGDIEPTDNTDFISSYNLYKAIANEAKGMKKWADDFFANIDKDNFYKYLFYQAVQAYALNDYPKAITLLEKILKLPLEAKHLPFIKKAARTLARIYFKQENYLKSLDIYETFLTRLNPVTPSDWLEMGWNLYYLKRYQESLGILYNLESQVVTPPHNLENYIIRALVYLDLCATDNVEKLITKFQKTYDSAIQGIINGKPLRNYKDLLLIYSNQNKNFYDTQNTINNLITEFSTKLKKLSRDSQPLASFIYKSEYMMLSKKINFYLENVYNASATQLIMTAESLKFLKFSVMREKFNPDTVFNNIIAKDFKNSFEDIGDKGFTLIWEQKGDYWRDERNKYFGDISNQCVK